MIDEYGHCVSCHKNLLTERVIDGQVMKVFLPDKDETEFLLDDGSRMRVCICKKCKLEKDLNNKKFQETIMQAVIGGWEKEVKELIADENKPFWTKEQGDKHMDTYSKKNIISHSEGLEDRIIKEKLKEKESK